jgi:phosphopantetheinyl transferase (holo-ACP synthase)
VAESLATDTADKWLLTGMDARVLLEVVLELESLAAVWAAKPAQLRSLCRVAQHVPLQPVDVRKSLPAHRA